MEADPLWKAMERSEELEPEATGVNEPVVLNPERLKMELTAEVSKEPPRLSWKVESMRVLTARRAALRLAEP